MRRPFLLYLLAVVAPSALAVAAGAHLAREGTAHILRSSQARVATSAHFALQQDLGAIVSSLVEEAGPWPDPDPGDPLAERARLGETAHGLVAGAEGLEVRVALPAPAGDTAGALSTAAAPLPPSVRQMAGVSGYRAALYVNGRRWQSTDPAPGPPELEPSTLQALSRAPDGLPFVGDDEGPGVLMPHRSGGAVSPALTVLMASGDGSTPTPVIPLPLLAGAALALIFSAVAGWIQLAGRPAGPAPGWLLVLSVLPALTAWTFLAQGTNRYDETSLDAGRRELGRALAAARLRDVADDPAAVLALTGYHTYRVRSGAVVAATLEGALDQVAALRAPPPNFTSTGAVVTPEGLSSYVALRLSEGDFVVATTPVSTERGAEIRRKSLGMSVALAGWLALVAAVSWRRRRAGLSS